MNQEKLLSILIPTRMRFEKLKFCLEKFATQLGADLPLVEFIVKFDSDDTESIRRIPELGFGTIDLQTYVADRLGGYKDLYVFYNQLARLSRGRLLMMWNDDATFKTDNWFSILKDEFTKTPGAMSYWFGGTPTLIVEGDGITKRIEDWPCFIAHHRLLYEIMGFYSHVGGCDSFLYYVLGPLGLLRKLNEIQVDHVAWFNIPENERDKVSHENAGPGQMLPTDFDVVRRCQERIRAFASRSQQQQPPPR